MADEPTSAAAKLMNDAAEAVSGARKWHAVSRVMTAVFVVSFVGGGLLIGLGAHGESSLPGGTVIGATLAVVGMIGFAAAAIPERLSLRLTYTKVLEWKALPDPFVVAAAEVRAVGPKLEPMAEALEKYKLPEHS